MTKLRRQTENELNIIWMVNNHLVRLDFEERCSKDLWVSVEVNDSYWTDGTHGTSDYPVQVSLGDSISIIRSVLRGPFLRMTFT